MRSLVRALTENEARTHRFADDPALRGRTYAIPFDLVWRRAVELTEGGLRGWSLTYADDCEGQLQAEATSRVFKFIDDVEIYIGLDEEAQTRVDMTSRSRKGKGDLGGNRRRIRRFFRELDRRVEATPRQILR